MKLRTQLIASMVFFAVVLAIISASVITTNQQVELLNKQEELAKNIELEVGELSYLSNDYLLYHEDQQIDRWNSKYSSFFADASNLTVEQSDQQVLVNNIKANGQRLKEIFDDTESRIESATIPQQNTVSPEFIQVSWSRIGVQTQGIVFDASRLAQSLREQADKMQQKNNLLVFSLMGAFIALLLANYLLFYRGTLRSIELLQTGTKVIGSGNLDYSLEEKRNDEIGELSKAFNLMTASLKTVTASKADLEREIDEGKHTEEALQKSEELFRLIVDNVPDALAIYDAERRYQFVNAEGLRRFGKPLEALVGRRVDDMYDELTRSKFLPALMRAYETGTLQTVEMSLNMPAGQFDLIVKFVPLLKDGRVNQVLNFTFDMTERNRAMKEIESLAKFPEENPNPVMRIGVDGNIVYANPSSAPLLKAWGLEVGGMLPDNYRDLTVESLRSGERKEIEAAAGNTIYSLIIAPFADKGYINVYGRDVTQQKLADKARKESEQRFRDAIDNFPNVFVIYDADRKVTYVNSKGLKIMGLTEQEVIGKKDEEIFPPEMIDSYLPALKLAVDTKTPQVLERTRSASMGGQAIIVNIVPLLDDNGEIRQILGLTYDITERKRAEEILHTTLQRFYAVLSSMYAGILLVADDGRIEFANQAFCDIFDLADSPADLKGLSSPEMIDKIKNAYLYPNEEVTSIREIVVRGQPVKGQEIAMRGGRTCLRDFIPLYVDGKSYGRLWHHLDITDRKRQEEQISRLTKLYSVLSRVNEAIVRAPEQESLYSEICRIVSEVGGYPLVWIGEVKEGLVMPVAWSGPASDYLKNIRVEVQGELGKGPTGTSIRENRSVVNDDFATNPATSPWRDSAIRYGFRASAAIPLHRQGKVIGVFTLYASEPNAFDIEQIGLLESLSADISYALDTLDKDQLRIQAEEGLRETRDYLGNLIDYANAPIIVWDPSFKITRFNHAFERLTGLRASEVLGEQLDTLFPEESRDASLEYISRTLSGERWEVVEIPIKKIDGSVRTVLWNSANIYDKDGTAAVATIAQGQDITERKQADEALRETKEYLENLIDYANAPIIVWDPSFRITRFNHAFERLTGLDARDVQGRPLDILFPEGSKDDSLKYINRALSGERWEVVEIPILRTDGSIRTVLWNSANIYDKASIVATIAQGQDITERKLAEEGLRKARDELEQRVQERTADLTKASIELEARAAELAKKTEDLIRSNSELEQFAYVASHDLQEPLRMISSYVQLLSRRYEGKLDKDADDFIAYAVEGTKRMQQLINDLLAYSRVGTRGKPPAPTDFEDVFSEAMSNLRMAAEEAGAVVTHDQLPTSDADRLQMVQLFQNLIGNAIKFRGKDTPQVHVSARPDGEVWVFSVRDNGIGIDPQFHDRIFTIFQRLHGRDEYPGTGIGLAVSKKIVERHGGRIWLDSTPGKGTTFYFTVPIKAERADIDATSYAEQNEGR